MSVTGSLSGLSISGISSGLDTDSIIKQLLNIEAVPVQRMQAQQDDLNTQMNVLHQFGVALTQISAAASALNLSSAFNPVTSSTSDSSVATITTSNAAATGNYDLIVTKLAQAHKIASAAQSGTSTALNLSGTLVVNGKGIQVASTDTLTSIAQKINGAAAGVSAGLIDGGSGSAYLTILANTSGAASKIQIADLQGNVAQSLGLVSGSDTIREAISGGATSYGLADATTNLGSLLKGQGLGVQDFHLNGVDVSFDPNTTSLQGLATAINNAGTGATASVRSATDSNGKTVQKLDITGLTSQTDDTGFLKALGVLQRDYGTQVAVAQDAAYSIDGINLTSSKNTITTAIPGATITLLKGTVGTPGKTTFSLQQDSGAVKDGIQKLVDSYNDMQDYVAANSKLDTNTFETGPLFGDPTVQQVQSRLSAMIFNNVPGLTGTYTNLASIGLGFDQSGKLTVDDAKLDAAVKSDPTSVAALFKSVGSSTAANLQFVSSTSKTAANGTAFAVNITQAAVQANYTATAAQTSALSADEVLTFNGSAFSNTQYQLTLLAGASQSAIVDAINNDATLKNLVTASLSGGKLVVTSKKYGTNGEFAVSSNKTAAADTSGIGSTPVHVSGKDVAGTINGETATGNGQFLTGATGNATSEGLQILYSGTATGNIGNITFTKGVSATLSELINNINDPTNGLLASKNNSLQTQIDNITDNINSLKDRLTQMQADLKQKFSAMEQAISSLQSQQARLTQMTKSNS